MADIWSLQVSFAKRPTEEREGRERENWWREKNKSLPVLSSVVQSLRLCLPMWGHRFDPWSGNEESTGHGGAAWNWKKNPKLLASPPPCPLGLRCCSEHLADLHRQRQQWGSRGSGPAGGRLRGWGAGRGWKDWKQTAASSTEIW